MHRQGSTTIKAARRLAERRRHGRVRPQGLQSNLGMVVDISPIGARVLCRRRTVGETELSLSNREGVKVDLQARAVWTRRLRARQHVVGFEFLNVNSEQAQELAKLFAGAAPRAGGGRAGAERERWGTGYIVCGMLLLLAAAAWGVARQQGALESLRFLPQGGTSLLIAESVTVFGGCAVVLIGCVGLLSSRPRKSRSVAAAGPRAGHEGQNNERFLESLLECSLSGVMVLEAVRDADKQVVDFECKLMNKAGEQLLGASAEMLVGQPLLKFLPCLKTEGLIDAGISVIETGLPLREDRRFQHDGRWYQYSAVRLGEGLAVTFADISDLRRNEQKLQHAAHHDTLTGLANRKLFGEHADKAIHRAKRNPNYRFAVLFLDFDRFKIVNDSLGHEAGDQLLVGIAGRLRENLRSVDTASRVDGTGHLPARLGGDEFVVLLDGIEHLDDAAAVAERLLVRFNEPHSIAGHDVISTASIGIVLSDPRYQRADDLLRDADIAMYHAKAAGKARYVVFDEQMHQAVVDRMTLERELREAVDAMAFALHYEPVVSLSTGELCGFEALVRWQHPQHGLVPPSQFVPVAEELQLINRIGHWVLKEACGQLQQWQCRHPEHKDLYVSVNLSRQQVFDPSFPQTLRQVIDEAQISPDCLRLEITESVVVHDIEAMTEILEQVKALGVHLAMDDFGTGHSSLNCLHRLPLDVLKIDRTFINSAAHKSQYGAILHAIVELAFNLEMHVIAEGVENEDQLTLLQGLGCEYAQGWLFSGPLTADDAEPVLQKKRPFARHDGAAAA